MVSNAVASRDKTYFENSGGRRALAWALKGPMSYLARNLRKSVFGEFKQIVRKRGP